jgi:hypothetical protein
MFSSLKSLFISAETLFPETACELPIAVVHTDDAEAEQLISTAYAARRARFDPIALGRLPRGITLCGGEFRVIVFNERLALESVPPGMRNDEKWLEDTILEAVEPTYIEEECVLLTRYGHGTWGHWLGEILPTAAIVERLYPGRFKYAVPQHASSYGAVMRESLRAYGIETNRILPVSWIKAVRFANAWAVTPIWSDLAPHPAALDVMRGAVRLGPYRPAWDKVGLLRRDWPTRNITNNAEIEKILEANGFTIVDVSALPFVDQVRMFQSANLIFGVLGSGLTGLIYSPPHVRVLTVGPVTWRDQFFYSLAQHRRAKWAEVHGPTRWDGSGLMRDAAFDVPIPALLQAMERLNACAP